MSFHPTTSSIEENLAKQQHLQLPSWKNLEKIGYESRPSMIVRQQSHQQTTQTDHLLGWYAKNVQTGSWTTQSFYSMLCIDEFSFNVQ